MENNYPNWIKVYIIDVLPGLTAGLYILGYLYNSFYYDAIGIDISHYITLSEMLIDIIGPLTIISLSFFPYSLFFIWFHYISTYANIKKNQKERKDISKAERADNWFYKRNKKFIIFLLISTVVPLVIYISINIIKYDGYYPSQIFIGNPLFMTFVLTSFFAPIFILSTPKPQKSVLIVETAVAIFIYSAILLGYCGYANGKFIRDYDTASFEIKTTDGTLFDNKRYRYTNQVSERVFLLEKSTRTNVVIEKDNISYMKIKMLNTSISEKKK